ncbi:hypothetical protein SIL73_11075 [Acidithiobacillus thiooxidans]|jgi:hypothetical protein|uniref:Uncharacterized protein n=1 Tax=Acidithiobacillus thiooxidans ATCC 19377 TaxID=637390 RepID=A0A5P9XS60_ACITH|nr:hypothetical protein [Acidithiobacillus thiooxidans]MDX5935224.1 hypothetical protein [Acidithiobacillus thiooxidans]QFX96434.1 hypothetical protein GCD22_02203 [Acidithiobacillus thiooxidans ATCC 19377]
MIKYITSDTKQATYLRDHLKFSFGGLSNLTEGSGSAMVAGNCEDTHAAFS